MPRVLFDAERSPGAAPGSRVELDERRSHHLVRVLRLRAGEVVEAYDGLGNRFRAEIAVADPKHSVLLLGERVSRDDESPLAITLAQCLSTAERMDWTIEKAVELGVRAIVPLHSERSQVRLDAARAARKHEHWQRIVESACTQSGRAWLPALGPLRPLREFVSLPSPARRLVLAPGAPIRLSAAGVRPGAELILLAGPESGFGEAELSGAISAGFEPVCLGPRILRTETAGLAAIAALQALAGDF